MVAHGKTSSVAAAMPRLSLSASPQVSNAANVHEFSLIEGNVQIEPGAVVAPGTAVTAEKGASVFVGAQCRLLPGVIVEAIAGAQVMLANTEPRSIYLGEGSVVAHKALIHSPAYVGEGCFVGFRSTVFNARLGEGCVVMMHALVQDVEVPPGRCVPSGAVIKSQHQADQLPPVRPEDLELMKEAVGPMRSAKSSRSGSGDRAKSRLVSVHKAANRSSPHQSSSHRSSAHRSSAYSSSVSRAGQSDRQASQSSNSISYDTEGANMQAQRLSPEIVQKVRQHLGQGYRIGMEHADKRRYRSGVWETCTPIKDTREQAVFEALERCLAEHQGEYVRMFGIDPAVKQRVGMVTVQRPGDKPAQSSGLGSSSSGSYGGSYSNQSAYSSNGGGSQSSGGLASGVAQEVRNLLSAGYAIGTEHAGPRHYRSNVWKVCSPIESRDEREVFSRLEHCLDEHSGEYIRMFGIDSQSKSRTATTTIQRADGKPVEVDARPVAKASGGASQQSSGYSSQSYSSNSGGSGGGEVAQAVSQIISSGNKIGIEFADKRRYRSGIWQTAPSISATNEAAANKQLQSFLNENADKYVRIFGINGQSKTRGSATTVQKPGQKDSQSNGASSNAGNNVSTKGREAARGPINENPPHYDDPAFLNRSGSGMDATVLDQVTRLVSQGHKISIEFADKRRYRSGIWKTGPAINASRPAEAISALGKQLAQHGNDYVRLIGIDTKAKRRVMEVTIQRPGQPNSSGGGSGSGQSSSRSAGRDPINANPPHYDDPSFRGQPSSYGQSGGYNSNGQQGGKGGMESGVLDQVTQLVNQGHKISLEYADKRRYRSGIWKTGSAISARRPAEAISELGKQLAQHQGEYVRLIGTDTQAKRRVLEATIQRP